MGEKFLFDAWAERYDQWYESPFGRSVYLLELEALQPLVSGHRQALEVGVGTGRFAAPLKIPLGLDPSRPMLHLARQRGIMVVQGVAEALPFQTHRFDLVLMMVTLCFVEDPQKSLAEARRVLRPGGHLVLGLIFRESPWAEYYRQRGEAGHPLYQEARFYSFREIQDLLAEQSFDLKEIRSTLFEPPQTEKPITCKEIKPGFHPEAGFFVILAEAQP